MESFKVYIIFSSSLGKYYVGYTSNFEQRLAFHNDIERNNIWTKRGQPWEMSLLIGNLKKSQALKIEKHIKKMKSKTYIKQLIEDQSLVEELKTKFG